MIPSWFHASSHLFFHFWYNLMLQIFSTHGCSHRSHRSHAMSDLRSRHLPSQQGIYIICWIALAAATVTDLGVQYTSSIIRICSYIHWFPTVMVISCNSHIIHIVCSVLWYHIISIFLWYPTKYRRPLFHSQAPGGLSRKVCLLSKQKLTNRATEGSMGATNWQCKAQIIWFHVGNYINYKSGLSSNHTIPYNTILRKLPLEKKHISNISNCLLTEFFPAAAAKWPITSHKSRSMVQHSTCFDRWNTNVLPCTFSNHVGLSENRVYSQL